MLDFFSSVEADPLVPEEVLPEVAPDVPPEEVSDFVSPEPEGVLEPLLEGELIEPLAEPLAEPPLLEGWSVDELELEVDGEVLGGVTELLELELLGGVLGVALEPLLEEDERDGDVAGGVVAPDDDEDEAASREAPRFASGPLSQPYNAPTARAIGRTTTPVFFNRLIRAPLG